MKKFLLSVAAMALFAAPVFAQEEQEVECNFYDAKTLVNEAGDEYEVPDYDSPGLKSMICTVTKDGPTTYTLHNAFGSENSITFSYNTDEIDEAGWAPLTFADPGNFDETFIKFQDYDYRMWNIGQTRWDVTGADGTVYSMNDICFRFEYPTPYILVEDGWFEVQIYYWGEYNDGNWGWLNSHYMIFTFDEFEEGDTAVANIEVNENAPVEYYNLQGMKVANPTNGLYIKRQGNKAQKVMLNK